MANYWKRNRALLITLAIVLLGIVAIVQDLEPKVWVSILLSGVTLAALYFLVREKDLQRAVIAIHSSFFSTPRCS